MATTQHRGGREGFTLVEIAIFGVILALVVGGVTSSFWTIQSAFDEERAEAEVLFRSRGAMDRLIRVTSNAVTTDAAYTLMPFAGVPPMWGLRFREIENVIGGAAVYDDTSMFHLVGPNLGGVPCEGVIIGRGPDLNAIWLGGRGADGVLGTVDDDTSIELAPGIPAVELLVPSRFAPETGPMLEFSDAGSASGRLITITLRTNFLRPDGTWLLADDHVLSERVALRW